MVVLDPIVVFNNHVPWYLVGEVVHAFIDDGAIVFVEKGVVDFVQEGVVAVVVEQ